MSRPLVTSIQSRPFSRAPPVTCGTIGHMAGPVQVGTGEVGPGRAGAGLVGDGAEGRSEAVRQAQQHRRCPGQPASPASVSYLPRLSRTLSYSLSAASPSLPRPARVTRLSPTAAPAPTPPRAQHKPPGFPGSFPAASQTFASPVRQRQQRRRWRQRRAALDALPVSVSDAERQRQRLRQGGRERDRDREGVQGGPPLCLCL